MAPTLPTTPVFDNNKIGDTTLFGFPVQTIVVIQGASTNRLLVPLSSLSNTANTLEAVAGTLDRIYDYSVPVASWLLKIAPFILANSTVGALTVQVIGSIIYPDARASKTVYNQTLSGLSGGVISLVNMPQLALQELIPAGTIIRIEVLITSGAGNGQFFQFVANYGWSTVQILTQAINTEGEQILTNRITS